jgi:stearoyl-CoA desaturase (delta-9 desaturase)
MSTSSIVLPSTSFTVSPTTTFTPQRADAAPDLRFDAFKSAWFLGMLVPALLWGPRLATPGSAAVTAFLTIATVCLGHSVGLHRGIIHQTYRCSRAVRNVLLYLFVLTGLGSPLGWMQLHTIRDRAQNDPRSPAVFGYEHGLIRDFVINLLQSFRLDDSTRRALTPASVRDDRYILFLARTWPLHQLPLAAALWFVGGWGYVVCGVCGRVAMTIFGHWFVGYVAHTSGQRPFRIDGVREEGTNVPVLGVISFGEGWHNNHHAFPDSAQFGLFPGQIDLGFVALRILQRIGWVTDVKTANDALPKRGVCPVTPAAARIVEHARS